MPTPEESSPPFRALLLRWGPTALFVLLPALLLLPVLRPGQCLFGEDFIAANYHVRGTVGKALAEGRLPVWDSYVMCGTPLLAAMHAGVLYPLTWPVIFISAGPFWTLTVWIHLALAGVFAFAWLGRGLGLSRGSSLAGALLFMLSGFVTSHVYHGHMAHVSTFPWAAAVMWRLERMLSGPSVRRGLFLAVPLALMLLAGFPQFAFILALAVGLRLIHFVLEEKEGRKARAGVALGAAAALAWAGLLAAPQLLPTMEMIGHLQRAQSGNYEFGSSFSMPPSQLVTLVAPMAFGDNRTVPDESSGFVGIAGLILGAIGAARRGRKRGFWAILALLGLLLSLGHFTPIYRLFYLSVPGVRLFRVPSRYLLLFTLAMAPLAALGVERLLSWGGDGFLARKGRWVALALSVLLTAELAAYNSRYFVAHPVVDMEWPEEFVSFVRGHPLQPFRLATVAMEQIPMIGKCQLAGIDHVGGYESMMMSRYAELCNVGRGKPASEIIVAMALARPSPVFDLLGARLWIIPGERREPPGWKTVGQLPSGYLYENPRALPRAFLVGRSTVIESREERLRALSSMDFDPRRSVIFESGAPSAAELPQGVRLRMAPPKPGSYMVQTECGADAFLVLSEMWYPGWEATVDGAPTEILRADHAIQAVRLSAGKHEVRFEYHSRFLRLGFALAAAGLVIPIGLLLWRRRRP